MKTWALLLGLLEGGCYPTTRYACVSKYPPYNNHEELKKWAEETWRTCGPASSTEKPQGQIYEP